MTPSDCPSGDVLGRYAAGELLEAEAETIHAHLGQCATCLTRLDELVCRPDSLVAALRQPRPPEPDSKTLLVRAMAAVLTPVVPSPGVEVGAVLNGYRILEEIGHGGMGRVYRALHPRLNQEVALKLLRPGMDSAPILARFEAERQTLALMDHPNIAKVLDAGTTADKPDGVRPDRPYFVMELVPGVAITRYSDEHHLDLRHRLELFIDVCSAVQHAHQKGIIHRDIKPGNVLVAEYDGKPVVKVIDFGIARAVDRRFGAETEVGVLIGTPEYVSPEQADLTSNDIDTRSDVYALGVLLYELLTGDTPFERGRLRQTPILEVLRLVREEEPPPPSTRRKGSAPHRLASQVRGELDWIVMKCLEKERNRRYESASALAEEVRRFLNDEPVQAGPPSRMYLVRKFVRRHRGAVLAVAAVLLTLLVGTAGTTAGMIRARAAEGLASERLDRAIEEQQRAEKEKARALEERDAAKAVSDFVAQDLLGQASTYRQFLDYHAVDPDVKLRTVLDRAIDLHPERLSRHPRVEARLRYVIGMTYSHLGEAKIARTHLERAWELAQQLYEPDDAEFLEVMSELGCVYSSLRDHDRAEQLLSRLVRQLEQIHGADAFHTLEARVYRTEAWIGAGRFQAAEPMCRDLLADCKRVLGTEAILTLRVESNFGWVLAQLRRFDEAEKLLLHAYQQTRRHAGRDSPGPWDCLARLAEVHEKQHRFHRAEPMWNKVLEERRRLLGPHHPKSITTTLRLGQFYLARNDFSRALPLLTQAYEERRRRLGADHRDTLQAQLSLAKWHLYQKQREDEAEKRLVEVRAAARRVCGPADTVTTDATNALALLHERRQQYAQAEPLYRELLEVIRATPEPAPSLVIALYSNLTMNLFRQGKPAEAEPILREFLAVTQKRKMAHFVIGVARVQLGDRLVSGKRYAEAEPLLVGGYEEMVRRQSDFPAAVAQQHLQAALRAIVRCYEAWGKPTEAARWRSQPGQQIAPAKSPR